MPVPPEESQGTKQPEGQSLGTTQRAQRNPVPGTRNDGGSLLVGLYAEGGQTE